MHNLSLFRECFHRASRKTSLIRVGWDQVGCPPRTSPTASLTCPALASIQMRRFSSITDHHNWQNHHHYYHDHNQHSNQVFIQRGHGPGGLPLNVYRGNSRRDKLLGETLEWWDDVENCLNMTSGCLYNVKCWDRDNFLTDWVALIVYITITVITTITTIIATIIAIKVSSSIARKSCFDRNWPWRWEQSHAEWKVFSFSPWTFQHFSIWTFQNMLPALTSKKTNPIQCRWTTNRRGEYDTQSLDRRLVRGAGGRPVGDHLGDHLSGHLGDHHGNHLSDHLTKHLGNHKHPL